MVLGIPLAAPVCEWHRVVHTRGWRGQPLLHTPTVHAVQRAVRPFTTHWVLGPKHLAVLRPGVVVAPLLCGTPSSVTVRGMSRTPPPLDKGPASGMGTVPHPPLPFRETST